MKTITKCFLYIAVMCPLGLADFYFALYGIAEGNWIVAALNIIAIVLVVFAIRSAYKTAKGYEKILCDSISDLQFHNMMLLLKDTIKSKEANPKDKDNEVEEHNGTPV